MEELDGLRGLAALVAIMYHYVAGPGTRYGLVLAFRSFLQVIPLTLDTFFILSGFLIGGILLRSKNSPNYYSTFYRRRFYRILPLYYAWIAVYFVLVTHSRGWGLKLPENHSTAFVFTTFLLMIQNFFPAIITSTYIVAPTWTLGVEEHFYVLVPLCVRRLSKRRLAQGLIAILALAPLLRGFIFKVIGHGNTWSENAVYMWTPCHADAIALGVLLAIAWTSSDIRAWLHEHSRFMPLLMLGFTVEGALLLYFNWVQVPYTYTLMQSLGRSGIALSCLCCMIFVLTRPQSCLCGLLRTRFLRETGKLSYCLYLVHWGVLWMITRYVMHVEFGSHPWMDVVAAIAAVAVSYAIAALSWKLLESPLIHRSHRYKY
jgi:peptidoglycan/LPS O-acetylase OafA/YrhL